MNNDLNNRPYTILIVDDEIAGLRLLTDILSSKGYKVRPTERPQSAIESAMADPPDLILLDVKMPEMSGFEVCRRLKQEKRTKDIPIIFVSGLQEIEDKIHGFKAGGVDFISKPFQESEILARVETHLHLYSMQMHLEDLVKERTSKLMISNKSLEAEIDKRQKVENSLRQSHDFLNNLTNSMGDAVYSVRMPERVIESINDSFNIFGYDPDECVGKTTEFLYPDRDKFLAFGDIMAEFIADNDRQILHMEQIFNNKTGKLFPVELTITKYKVNKEVVSLTAIARDISERKKAEAELTAYQKRLKALTSQLIIAEDKERSRIAAELHDHIGQNLAFSRIQVARAKKYAPEGKAATILDELSQSLIHTIRETKELIFDLSSPLLHEIGLSAAISNWLEDQVGRKNSIMVNFVHSGKELSLGNDIKSIVFRNVRELLCNVVKHAQATKVNVSLANNEKGLVIIVRDDGIGFDYNGTTGLVGIDSGFGLFSVKQQVEGLGGDLEVVSKPGKGCKAILTVPMSSAY
jgi:PAS domain S-box-containing protein